MTPRMIARKGYSFKTISNHKRSLKAAFYTAIQDDCIRKNPFDFHINTVIEDDTEPKIPLSLNKEESLLSFVKSDKVYYKYYELAREINSRKLKVATIAVSAYDDEDCLATL